jgi:hypothetical protein
MSQAEHEAMTNTGTVQEGAGGVTNVASPADPAAYLQQVMPPVLNIGWLLTKP